MSNFITASTSISGLILAGGAGRRAGGRDKGLIEWSGRPLIEHVYRNIASQVDDVLISCNRNGDRYAALSSIIEQDLRSDYQGPLAGLEAAAPLIVHPLLMVVPCDTPHLPENLVSTLFIALEKAPEQSVAYATTGDGGQYLCALMRTESLQSLPAFLDSGQRAVRQWYRQIGSVAVDMKEQSACFLNVNELD
ncbi:MAG: molybdenum cofactor guanylyltransferase MobA [Halioglobus sp.]